MPKISQGCRRRSDSEALSIKKTNVFTAIGEENLVFQVNNSEKRRCFQNNNPLKRDDNRRQTALTGNFKD